MLHLVFAVNSRLVLGQEAVDDKANETTAIPVLLEKLPGHDRDAERRASRQLATARQLSEATAAGVELVFVDLTHAEHGAERVWAAAKMCLNRLNPDSEPEGGKPTKPPRRKSLI